MKASLRALLTGVIDYAGLFPPAKLPLDEAIRNYARYRTEPGSWMLGRFICPASRLRELVPFVDELFSIPTPPLTISVLGRGGETADEFLAGLNADLKDVADVQQRLGSCLVVGGYEVRLPAAEVNRQLPFSNDHYLAKAAKRIDSRAPFEPDIDCLYCEADWGSQPREAVGAVMDVMAAYNGTVNQYEDLDCELGFKLRCGGLTAAAFPSVEQVAGVVHGLLDRGLRFKATAGLHHPFRRFDAGVQTHMHGFLNVFVAGVLACARGLSEEQVRRIVEDEVPASFRFDDEGLSWKEYRATVPEIEAARRQAVISFGSCSFDEPRDDLRALGLL